MKININENVKVKLTDSGLKELKGQYDSLKLNFPNLHEFKEPEKDENGYSEIQLHSLFNRFGHLLHLGNNDLPFETVIKINDKDENEILGFKIFEIDDGETYWYIGESEEEVIKFHIDEMEPDPEYDVEIKHLSIEQVNKKTYMSERLIDCDLYQIQKLNIEKDNGSNYEYPMSVEVLTRIATHYAKKSLEVETSSVYFIAMTGCY